MPPVAALAATTASDTLPPLRSTHTTGFAEILTRAGISLLVTTYQCGKLVIVRADEGVVNTHFRSFAKPMGIAIHENRLALGTAMEIWEFHNAPAVASKLEPIGRHDACYLPRCRHITGEVLIHEMAWVQPASTEASRQGDSSELCFVNTRFSCLCRLDGRHSFVPWWRPPFLSTVDADDRCHLNGLEVVAGRVRYVTALGETDTANGWRATKVRGGILMEVPSGRIVVRGLSMPHSPRWHRGKLWLLESGTGTIGTVDCRAGRYEPLAKLPGFTRGLDFFGRFAFIGLSQVRESAVFSGIPLTDRLDERICGVWVLDLATGATVAFLKFADAVQEIFDVRVLRAARFPELIHDDLTVLSDSFVLPPNRDQVSVLACQ
jgi:uncharacterized protein (TIGR03032 family)